MQRLTRRDLVLWGVLPVGLTLVVMLACVEPAEECYSASCQPLTPAQKAELEDTRTLLLGTWELSQEAKDRDDVERLLLAGRAVWSLEIFEVERATDGLYNWTGAVRPLELCLVPRSNFDAQIEECETLSPVQPGRCYGHSCTVETEFAVSGQYDTEEKVLTGGSSGTTGRMFFLNPEVGYANLSASLVIEMLVRGPQNNSATCERYCDWNITTGGLFEDQFMDYRSDELSATLVQVSADHRPAGSDVDTESERELPVGSQDKVEELLMGEWSVRSQLEGLDEVERPVSYGDARYTLEIFEVTPVEGQMGTWDYKGALRATSLCMVPIEEAEADTFACETFTPATIGSCSGATCTASDEMAVTGRFRDLDNKFSIDYDYEDARSFYLDDRGYVYASVPITIEGATLTSQAIAPTRCVRACRWSMRTDGAYKDSHGSWSGDERTFEMSR